MKFRRRSSGRFAIISGVILLLVATGLLWAYESKRSIWKQELANVLPLAGPIQSFPTNKVRSLLSGGSLAVSYLLDRIEGNRFQRVASRYSGPLPMLNKFAFVPDLNAQYSIPIILEQMSEAAIGHLPRMERIFLAAPATHLNLLNAIGAIGCNDPETAAFLMAVGLDRSIPVSVRENCALFLGRHKRPDEIVEVLTQFYSDSAPGVQASACRALGMRGVDRRAVPLLVDALRNPNADVRRSALTSLAQADTNRVAVQELALSMVNDTNREVSMAAQRVLKKMEKSSAR